MCLVEVHRCMDMNMAMGMDMDMGMDMGRGTDTGRGTDMGTDPGRDTGTDMDTQTTGLCHRTVMVTTLIPRVTPLTHPAPARRRTGSDMDTPCAGHCCRRLTSRDRTLRICRCEYSVAGRLGRLSLTD